MSKANSRQFIAVLDQKGDGYVSLSPKLDVASPCDTIEEAMAMLKEAVSLYLEHNR
ncbi:MAG: type II toxin-antitoxin system HicB family antitoxin [Verrucomicrobiota bacterium]